MLERLSVDLTTNLHNSAHRLERQIACRILCIGSDLSKVCDRRDDKVRFPGKHLVYAEAPLFKTAGSKTLDDYITLFHQSLNQRLVFSQF